MDIREQKMLNKKNKKIITKLQNELHIPMY